MSAILVPAPQPLRVVPPSPAGAAERGRGQDGTSAPLPGGKRGEEAARCREETQTSGPRIPPRPPPAPPAMARRPGGP